MIESLREWRIAEKLSFAAAARRIGASSGKVVWRWETGELIPNRVNMMRLYRESGGAVQPNHFYGVMPAPDRHVVPEPAQPQAGASDAQ